MTNSSLNLRGEIKRLRKALRNLIAMNRRLDPTDEERREMKAALLALKVTRL
jgi:hypothetical protein